MEYEIHEQLQYNIENDLFTHETANMRSCYRYKTTQYAIQIVKNEIAYQAV